MMFSKDINTIAKHHCDFQFQYIIMKICSKRVTIPMIKKETIAVLKRSRVCKCNMMFSSVYSCSIGTLFSVPLHMSLSLSFCGLPQGHFCRARAGGLVAFNETYREITFTASSSSISLFLSLPS